MGHTHHMSISNTRKLERHVKQLKKLIQDAQYKDYLEKIEDINKFKMQFKLNF